MAHAQGAFVWYELMTTDMAAAESFYTKVIGWQARAVENIACPYTIFSQGSVMVGGLMPIPEVARAKGAPTSWSGYIAVDDVDAYVKRVTGKGGMIHHGPEDIPGVGRFAVVADPYKATFILFTPTGGPPPAQVAPDAVGHVGWRELFTDDREGAFAFYSDLFGWTKVDAVNIGDMGIYQTFATGGPAVGGMMTKPSGMPKSFWQYYFTVPAVDAAVARVTSAGGKVLRGPHQVPTGSWIVQCTDPQGAMFALVGATR